MAKRPPTPEAEEEARKGKAKGNLKAAVRGGGRFAKRGKGKRRK